MTDMNGAEFEAALSLKDAPKPTSPLEAMAGAVTQLSRAVRIMDMRLKRLEGQAKREKKAKAGNGRA